MPNYLETDFARHTPNEVLVAACPISDVEHVVEAVQLPLEVTQTIEGMYERYDGKGVPGEAGSERYRSV